MTTTLSAFSSDAGAGSGQMKNSDKSKDTVEITETADNFLFIPGLPLPSL